MTYILAGVVVVGIIQSVLTWRVALRLRKIDEVSRRLSQCSQGLALLVDTTEAGFTMVGGELARIGPAQPKRPSAVAASRRIGRAAKQGQSVAEIAASEGVSEGEVRLRLFMQNAGHPDRSPGERGRAPLRA